MPYKDPEKRRAYSRTRKDQRRAKDRIEPGDTVDIRVYPGDLILAKGGDHG